MTLTLRLSQDLEHRLTREAERIGLPIEQYALRLLGDQETTRQPPATGADLLGFWQREGVIGSRPDILNSQSHAREIRRRVEQRDRD